MSGSSRDLAPPDPCAGSRAGLGPRHAGRTAARRLHLTGAAWLVGLLAFTAAAQAEVEIPLTPPRVVDPQIIDSHLPGAGALPTRRSLLRGRRSRRAIARAVRGSRARRRRVGRADGGNCPDAYLVPAPDNLSRVDAATLCLIDVQRARAGRPSLSESSKLVRAATAHSQDMTARGYFDHVSPDGGSVLSRLLAVGFVHPAAGYDIGENIAWATGQDATPASVVDMWMHSPEHRSNILHSQYRQSGVGVSPGVPDSSAAGQPGATYTADFGA